MKAVWDRIHVWLRAHAPEVLQSLRPGASEAQLRAAEQAMGVTLPDDVRACYAVHDGQGTGPYGSSPGFLYGWEWCSLGRMVEEWRCWKGLLDTGTFDDNVGDPHGLVRPVWWHPGWIPLTCSGAGDNQCLDLAPATGGRVGQVIEMWHDDAHRAVLARSFAAWVAAFADELEDGAYSTSPDYDGLVPVEDLL